MLGEQERLASVFNGRLRYRNTKAGIDFERSKAYCKLVGKFY